MVKHRNIATSQSGQMGKVIFPSLGRVVIRGLLVLISPTSFHLPAIHQRHKGIEVLALTCKRYWAEKGLMYLLYRNTVVIEVLQSNSEFLGHYRVFCPLVDQPSSNPTPSRRPFPFRTRSAPSPSPRYQNQNHLPLHLNILVVRTTTMPFGPLPDIDISLHSFPRPVSMHLDGVASSKLR